MARKFEKAYLDIVKLDCSDIVVTSPITCTSGHNSGTGDCDLD